MTPDTTKSRTFILPGNPEPDSPNRMITLLELAACVSALGTIVAPSLVIAVLLLVGTFLATGV